MYTLTSTNKMDYRRTINDLQMHWLYRRQHLPRKERRQILADEIRELRRNKVPREVIKHHVGWMIWVGVYPSWVLRQFPC